MENKKLTKEEIRELAYSKADTSQVIKRLETKLKRVKERGGLTEGISTGFNNVDIWTDGMSKGHLWVIGGGSSVGKTAFTSQLVLNAVKEKARVAYFLMETTAEDLMLRMLGAETNIAVSKLKYGDLGDNEMELLEMAKIHTVEGELMIFDDELFRDVAEVSALLQHYKDQGKPFDIVVYDHLDHARKDGKNSEYELKTDVIYDFQTMAKTYDTCVIVLSQLALSVARDNGMEYLSYKGSGGILDACECGWVLSRKREDTPEILTATLWKNRHGQTGKADLHFNLASQRITLIDKSRSVEALQHQDKKQPARERYEVTETTVPMVDMRNGIIEKDSGLKIYGLGKKLEDADDPTRIFDGNLPLEFK